MLSGVQKRQSTLIKSDLQAYEVLNLTLAFHKRGKKNPLRSDSPTHLNTLGALQPLEENTQAKAGFWSPCLPPELLGITSFSLELPEHGIKQIQPLAANAESLCLPWAAHMLKSEI